MTDDREDKRIGEFDRYSFNPPIEFGYTTSNTRIDKTILTFDQWFEFIGEYFFTKNDKVRATVKKQIEG